MIQKRVKQSNVANIYFSNPIILFANLKSILKI